MVMSMRKTSVAVGGFVMMTAFATAPASAQSSGNFAASVATAQCTVSDTDGALGGGISGTLLETTLKTPNSGGTALVIRPSLVTGLYTKSKTTATNPVATAVAGVKVRVLLDGKAVAPGTPVGSTLEEDGWIYYDKRFQQLSTNIFDQVTECGTLEAPEVCYIELIQSTLSAHSFDFVVGNSDGGIGGGDHSLKVEWKLEPSAETATEKACVGPGVLTVQQVKTFSTGGGIVIQ
jgi:hypothetical protein